MTVSLGNRRVAFVRRSRLDLIELQDNKPSESVETVRLKGESGTGVVVWADPPEEISPIVSPHPPREPFAPSATPPYRRAAEAIEPRQHASASPGIPPCPPHQLSSVP